MMTLEQRKCPTCQKSFKVLPSSQQIYCSQKCIEFRGGVREKFSFKTMLDYKRNSGKRDFNGEIKSNKSKPGSPKDR